MISSKTQEEEETKQRLACPIDLFPRVHVLLSFPRERFGGSGNRFSKSPQSCFMSAEFALAGPLLITVFIVQAERATLVK